MVERCNQTVVRTARCMLKGIGMPAQFWGEAVTTAVFVLNRSFTRSVDGRTPYEAWHGTKPKVHFLRVFGCRAHAKITTPNLKKVDDRSKPMVMLGYEPGGKAYRLYDPTTKRVHVSRDVIFDESAGWDWSNDNMVEDYGGGEFTIEYSYAPAPTTLPVSPNQSNTATPAQMEIQPENNSDVKSVATAATEHTPVDTAEQVRLATPPSGPDPELLDDTNDPDHPHRYRRVLDMVEPDAPVPGQAERLLLTPSVSHPHMLRRSTTGTGVRRCFRS